MPLDRRRIGWWSPDPRGVLPLDGLKVSRSLRKSSARFEVRFDTCFEDVMRACADPHRPHGWINEPFVRAYTRLHRMGWAHSVECRGDDGELVGGLYGVRINRFFAGDPTAGVLAGAFFFKMFGLPAAALANGLVTVRLRVPVAGVNYILRSVDVACR